MAIEITSREKISKSTSWAIFGVVLCVILAITVGSSYLFFTLTLNKMNKEIIEKDKASADLTENILKKEAEILPLRSKVSDIGVLIGKHKTSYNVFGIIEKNCLPKVWFSSFSFNAEEQKASLSGTTESFKLLDQQITILKKEPLLKKVTLTNASKGEEGGVTFNLELVFAPEVFKLSF